jgi:predicted HTH domain antitoxin
MQIQLIIPDDLAHNLEDKWGNLEKKLLEMLILEAYQEGSISVGKVRELMGLATRLDADSWLKSKGLDLHYNESDFEADRQTHNQLHQEGLINTP